ncbi:hypothetical protein [Hymenobacter perfusus]|uniref:Uncharacterized protein n=1 Tax=Hymenobacter perfusus TaxID=1236770 RepID=A0A3R9V368_9BACT|nr:hypothetical protein [Hymenobacter perfusus]RSK45770.1 hypothetical protein EI293_00945 [Hymenobacter perfusus]
MITIDQAKFLDNLRITQAYCEQQLQQKEKLDWVILRSAINPVCRDEQWFVHMLGHNKAACDEQPIPLKEWARKSDPYYHDSFVELFNLQLDFKTSVSDRLKLDGICQGKILVVEHGENIPDGAADPETNSFFDEWDLPPIDTWFYNDYSPSRGGILFAWIPEKFIRLADVAIEIQFLNILHWFEKPSNWNI